MIKRNTIQRTLVLEVVNKLKNHPTADEVYEELIKSHPSISRCTVYRNLNQLSEEGLIQKIEVPSGADRFDYKCYNHYHVKCIKCGKIFDVKMEYLPDLEKKIKDSHGFEFKGYDIIFKGICPNCQCHK